MDSRYDAVIVRYGEIFLKSEYVKRQFEDILIGNIKKRLSSAGITGKIVRARCRLYVKAADAKKAAEALKSVYGIVSVSPATEVKATIDDISLVALDEAKAVLSEGDTFAVRAQRSGKHSFKSKDVEMECGSRIIDALSPKVDLEKPCKTIYVEIRDDVAYVFSEKIEGFGGLPYKSQEKLVCLISNGIDSPVAAWMMMRRGCSIVLLHFGEESEIKEIADKLGSFIDGRLELFNVPHKECLEKIAPSAGKYTCIICKRLMYRTAEELAKKEGAYGIVTGDNIGQVASQTLENLSLINCVDLPVYRPLVAMDKEDIITVAKKIGTFGLAKTGRCPFVPDKPATRGDSEKIREIESKISFEELIKDAQENHLFKD